MASEATVKAAATRPVMMRVIVYPRMFWFKMCDADKKKGPEAFAAGPR
jgi:hypothetical protein